jgi:hypothetical protein
MTPTYTYFDRNRAQRGIVNIAATAAATACASNTENLDLYHWPGSVAGYRQGAVYKTGTAPTVSTTGTVNAVEARATFTANNWRSVHFCATRMAENAFTLRNNKNTACAAHNVACSECECLKGTQANPAVARNGCPYSTYFLNTGAAPTNGAQACNTVAASNAFSYTAPGAAAASAATYTQYCTWGTVDKASYLVDLGVEMFGTPCRDPAEHPAAADGQAPWMAVIKEVQSPCNVQRFGTDTVYSHEADQYPLGQFVQNNNVFSATSMGTVLYDAYKTSTEKAKLFGRFHIETGCSAACQDFRIAPHATAMYTQMMDTYGDIRVILYISVIGGVIAMCVCLYLVSKYSRATQKEYTYFYEFCLVVLTVIAILLIILVMDMRRVYNVQRARLLEGAACISDQGWANVPRRMHAESNMDSEHTWACVWLATTLIMIVVMVYVFCTSS